MNQARARASFQRFPDVPKFEDKFTEVGEPRPSLPRPLGKSDLKGWIEGIWGGPVPQCNFVDFGGPFTEAAVQILGRKTQAFEVVVGDDPQLLLPEALETFDAIFLNGLHDLAPFLPRNWKSLPPDELAAATLLA